MGGGRVETQSMIKLMSWYAHGVPGESSDRPGTVQSVHIRPGGVLAARTKYYNNP